MLRANLYKQQSVAALTARRAPLSQIALCMPVQHELISVQLQPKLPCNSMSE